MRNITFHKIYLFLIILLTASVGLVNAQRRPYRVNDSQVQYLLNRIEQKTDAFKRNLDSSLDRSRLNGSDTEDMINGYVTDFENATDSLKQRFDARKSVSSDVENVLSRAAFINSFMTRNRLGAVTERNWRDVRSELETLANYYSVAWNWNNPTTPVYNAPYRVKDSEVQALLNSIEGKTDNFKRTINRSLDRSRLNNTNSEDSINEYITAFENSTDSLKQKFDAHESVDTDVQDVLMKANAINGFLRDYKLNRNVQNQWDNLRTDLNTLSSYYNVSWNWDTTYPTTPTTPIGSLPYTVNDRQVQTLLTNIESRTDMYKRDMNIALDASILNNTRSETAITNYITEFENATDRLKQNFDARRSTTNDVNEVLSRAAYIDGFMRDYRFVAGAERDWNLIKSDLNTLSNYYSVSWNWNNPYQPQTRFDSMLSGTYRLNVSESDNVSEVVDRAANAYFNNNQRERLERNLERRLESPNMIAIEKRGDNVTIASSNSPQISFVADGTTRTETMPNGRRTVNVTARTNYDGVALSYEGDRVNDFYVNFMPVGNDRLRVVRRVYLENRNETVTVASVYDKVNETAQWGMVNNGSGTIGGNTNYDFVVPNGTQVRAVLTSGLISTKASQNGDKFTMRVTSPNAYDGAIIEGHVVKAENSGRVSGRANISLDFDTIRLRNGRIYNFAGILDGVTAANGDDVKVNNEGTVRDSNQTTKTVTRAGIGAAIGALIGAIANGGQGAAIGAAIGAGAGAGTVFIEGRDNIELGQGSEFAITASSPANISSR